MIQQEINFDRPHNNVPTSIAAADSLSPDKAETYRARILMFVQERGNATRDEIEAGTGIAGNTIRPRVDELKKRGQLIETDEQRSTRSGRKAFVLKPTARL